VLQQELSIPKTLGLIHNNLKKEAVFLSRGEFMLILEMSLTQSFHNANVKKQDSSLWYSRC
jgi:hypothetical protein